MSKFLFPLCICSPGPNKFSVTVTVIVVVVVDVVVVVVVVDDVIVVLSNMAITSGNLNTFIVFLLCFSLTVLEVNLIPPQF